MTCENCPNEPGCACDPQLSFKARTGVSHPLGKCDTDIETTVPSVVAEAVIALKTLTGRPAAEITRNAIIEKALGVLAMTRPSADNTRIELAQALEGLAFMKGVSKEEYIRSVLFSHVFGDVAFQKLRLAGGTENPGQ